MSGDWFDVHAWADRYREQLDKRIAAEMKAEAAARARELELQRVEAGDPVAMRQFVERLAAEHQVAITWTADRDQWFARVERREVSIPPACDLYAVAIDLHEIAHVVFGPCRGPGHQAHRDGQKHRCLECEREAWRIAGTWVAFSRPMFERMRAALGTYRRLTPAPTAAQQRADRDMAFVTWALKDSARQKWQDRADKLARWKRELERQQK